jgi:outer membrane lipoprotein-sorting protein
MRPADDIKRFIDKAAVRTNPQADKAVLSMLLTAHKGTTVKTPAGGWPDIRNIVMRSPMMKLGIAAVVVVVVAGIGMLEFVSSGRKSGVAWAEVLEKTEQTSAVVFDRTIEVNEPEGKFMRRSKTYMARDYGERSDTFMDGKLMEIDYRLPRKNVVYRILVDRKQYWRRDVSYDQAALDREPDDPRTWLKRLLSGDDYTKLGRTTIDGVVVEGVEGRQLESSGETVMRVWVDVKANLPVRIEMKGMEGGQMMKLVMENFEWDAPLDESLFEPNIPADYTPLEDRPNPRAQPTSARALTEQEQAAVPQIQEIVRLYLQALRDQNWDEMDKYVPGVAQLTPEQHASIHAPLDGLQVGQIGQPFKTEASDIWHVPCQIGLKGHAPVDGAEVRVRYDSTLGRFVVFGGP